MDAIKNNNVYLLETNASRHSKVRMLTDKVNKYEHLLKKKALHGTVLVFEEKHIQVNF